MGIYERSNIAFARPIQPEEIHGLLAHVKEEVGFRSIDYRLTLGFCVPVLQDEEPLKNERLNLKSSTLKGVFMLTVLQMVDCPAMMCFEGYKNVGTDFRKIDGFRFVTTPGYEERDLPKGELILMDSTRRAVAEYIRRI